ncbi:MAG: PEP-CTERM sorting domain-containing protein [Alphaproteobacteria bacterium]
MATRDLTTSAFKATLATLALLAVALPSPARADLISELVYHLTICGGSGIPQPGSACYVEQAQAPIPSLDGLGDALKEFYDPIIPGIDWPPDTDWKNAVTGANNMGYVYGLAMSQVHGCGGLCWLSFVYYQPDQKIVFSGKDFPYTITGANDNGLFVGHYPPNGFVFSSEGPNAFVERLPTLDAASIAMLESIMPAGEPANFFWFEGGFLAIDNANRISGFSSFGPFILTPVPEPASSALVLAGLGMMLWLRRNRNYSAKSNVAHCV